MNVGTASVFRLFAVQREISTIGMRKMEAMIGTTKGSVILAMNVLSDTRKERKRKKEEKERERVVKVIFIAGGKGEV